MITTYAIYDNAGRDVVGYCSSLTEAKYHAVPGNYIVTLVGPHYGEGFHTVIRRAVRTKGKVIYRIVKKLGGSNSWVG